MLHNNVQNKPIYLKTFTLRDIGDISEIKNRITPLAQKDVDDLRIAVEQLYKSVSILGGDISRLGEERIIITPPSVKIWHKDVDAAL